MIRNYTLAQNKQKQAASCRTQRRARLYLFFQQCLLPVPAAHGKQLWQVSELPVPALRRGRRGTEGFFLSFLNMCPPQLNFGMPCLIDLHNDQGEPLPLLSWAQHLPSAPALSTLSAGDPKSRVAAEHSPGSSVLDRCKPLPPYPTSATPPRPFWLLIKKSAFLKLRGNNTSFLFQRHR